MYLHVVIKKPPPSEEMFLFGDLSESELKRRFIRVYDLGGSVMKENRIIGLNDVEQVWIVETKQRLEKALKILQKESNEAIDRINRESEFGVILSAGSGWKNEDIRQCGKDVTATYLNRPPGQGTRTSNFVRLLNNPWAYGVGGAMLIAAGGALINWFWK